MTTVTVCVPAYRSGPLIAHTLRSLQRQTHRDILVRIAVEPPAQETLAAIAPFLTDRRFQVSVNPARLGWDGNIRSLLSRVETPAFTVMPHDDILHSRAIEILLGELERVPGASVAYGDMFVFGACRPFHKFVDLPLQGTREDQILAFFLAGAEAVPWRGVTRTRIVSGSGGFPMDGFMGFAVECEWALRLLVQGAAIRVPRRLYFKRVHPPAIRSASRDRLAGKTADQLLAAWERHRGVMLMAMEEAVPPESPRHALVKLAAELAMLRRLLEVSANVLPEEQRRRARDLAAQADSVAAEHPAAGPLAAALRQLGSPAETKRTGFFFRGRL